MSNPPHPRNLKSLQTAVNAVLGQKLNLLRTISQKDYVNKTFCSPSSSSSSSSSFKTVSSSSVGAHVRHSLDHFSALLSADVLSKQQVIDYDVRERNTSIESDKKFATSKTLDIIKEVEKAFSAPEKLPLAVEVRFVGNSSTGESYMVPSTFAREMSFVAHHGIHHIATIKSLMQQMGYEINDDVGKAFATVAHEENK